MGSAVARAQLTYGIKKARPGIDICRMELTLLRTMRGEDKKQSSMLVLMSPETRVPQTHPLRAIKKLADEALATLSPVFDAMYAEGDRRGHALDRRGAGSPSPHPARVSLTLGAAALVSVGGGAALGGSRDGQVRVVERRDTPAALVVLRLAERLGCRIEVAQRIRHVDLVEARTREGRRGIGVPVRRRRLNPDRRDESSCQAERNGLPDIHGVLPQVRFELPSDNRSTRETNLCLTACGTA